MIAEGSSYALTDAVLDTSAVLGVISAQVDWGDGTRTTREVDSPPSGPIRVRFDYSLDTEQFFNTSEKRAILQTAADLVFSRFSDSLSAIAPSGSNRWEAIFPDPTTGANVRRSIGTLAANEIVIFVGSRDLPGNNVAIAGPGGLSWSGSAAWGQSVVGRGQPGAIGASPTDFGPWGGSMTVDSNTNWHFGPTTDGLHADNYDFLTAVSHEFMHILGFGVAPSWQRIAAAGQFAGPVSAAANGGQPVPLSGDLAHWREGLQSAGQETLMDPSINGKGVRKLPTPLDLAGLVDIGWNLIPQQTRVSSSHTYADDGKYPINVVLSGSRAGERGTTLAIVDVGNVAPTLNPQSSRQIQANTRFDLVDLGVFQDVGFGPTESFQSYIDWGDGSSADQGIATIDRPGSAGVATEGSFDGSHTYTTIGNYTVRYRVIDDDGGAAEQTFSVQVVSPPTLRISLDRNEVREDAGPGGAVLRVSRSNVDLSLPLDVKLSSSNTAVATVPLSITIPAYASWYDVSVTVIDDSIVDGLQTVQFTSEATGYFGTSVSLGVQDFEPLQWVEQGLSIAEAPISQPVILTIILPAPAPSPGTVLSLSTDLDGQLNYPPQLVIPAGQTTGSISISAINDEFAESPKKVQLRATSPGMDMATIAIVLTDDDRSNWTNANNVYDVDGNGSIDPIDVLQVINFLRRQGSGELPDHREPLGPPFVDTNGNGVLEPLDVLLVINALNRRLVV